MDEQRVVNLGIVAGMAVVSTGMVVTQSSQLPGNAVPTKFVGVNGLLVSLCVGAIAASGIRSSSEWFRLVGLFLVIFAGLVGATLAVGSVPMADLGWFGAAGLVGLVGNYLLFEFWSPVVGHKVSAGLLTATISFLALFYGIPAVVDGRPLLVLPLLLLVTIFAILMNSLRTEIGAA